MKTFGFAQTAIYAVIALAVAYVVYRVFKLGEGIKDAAVNTWNAVTDVGSAAVDDVVAGHAAVVGAVSGAFKSDAEKSVDDLYGPNQGWKATVAPPRGKSIATPDRNAVPKNFTNPDVYTLIQLTNAPPPSDPTLAPMRLCDVLGTCGDYPKATAPLGGTAYGASNIPAKNNDTNFTTYDAQGNAIF